MEDIRKHKVTNSYINQDRSFVYLDIPFNGKKTIPRAHYNWLLGNPQFEDVPPGYCVHHLDLDELNDDISNLVIMKLNKNNDYEKVKLRAPIGIGTDLTIPKVTQSVAGKTQIWRIRWQETSIGGKRVNRGITRIHGNVFRTKEEAERGKELLMKIHPSFKSKEEMTKIYELIRQINQEIEPRKMEDVYQFIKKIFPQI